ncbi:MAG: aldo/keto reductase [Pseudomonadota bacterium]
MKFAPLGKSGLEASVVGFGSWAIGGWKWGGADAQDAVKAVQTALDSGINLIDTAPVYGFGLSEDLVGEAIKGRKRDDIIIATKCGLRFHVEDADERFTPHGSSAPGQEIYRNLTRASVRFEIEESLKRLGTDYIDLYQPHWQDPNVASADIMETLLELKKEGKIRAIGTCNATVEELEAYAAVGPLDTDQELYNALERQREDTNLAWCAHTGAGFLAYSPMAQGLLTGKIPPEREFPDTDIRHGNPKYSTENRQHVADLLAKVQPIADAHGARLEHVMLAWTLGRRGCSHVLVGGRNAQQAAANAKAGSLTLSDDELAHVSAAVDEFGGLRGV